MIIRKKLQKFIVLITALSLFTVSWSSISPQVVQAGSDNNQIKTTATDSTNGPKSEEAKKVVMASQQKAEEDQSFVPDLSSPFKQANQSQSESPELLDSLNSPLVITPRSDLATGDLDSTGTYYLQANVSYLVRSYYNDTNAANSTYITVYKADGSIATQDLVSFTLYENTDKNSTKYTVAAGGKSKTNKMGDKLSDVNNATKSGLIFVNTYKPVGIGGGSIPEAIYPSGNSWYPVMVSATVKTDQGTNANPYLTVYQADIKGTVGSSVQLFPGSKVKMWLNDDIATRVLADNINYARNELKNKNIASLDGNVKITWNVWTKNGNKGIFLKTRETNLIDYTTDLNQTVDLSKMDQESLKFEHNFFVEGYLQDNYVFVDIELGYMTKKPILGSSKHATYRTRIGSYYIRPSIVEPIKAPVVSINNTVNNMTDPGKDEIDAEGNVYTINHTSEGDMVKYSSNLRVNYEEGDSLGQVQDGNYEVSIPKGMSITNAYLEGVSSNVSGGEFIDPEYINITDDPNDATKQILTISNILLKESTSVSTSQNDFKLTFDGKIPEGMDKSHSFTPTFDGIGFYDSAWEPVYVDKATGKQNNINFDDEVDEGEITIHPQDISYGTMHPFVDQDLLKGRETPDAAQDILDVKDSRANKHSVTISLQAAPLSNKEIGDFPGNLVFIDNSGVSHSLENDNIVNIFKSNDGEEVMPINWVKDKGLLLSIKKNKNIPAGTYETTLNWCVTNSL